MQFIKFGPIYVSGTCVNTPFLNTHALYYKAIVLDSGFGLFEDCPKPSVVWTHAHTVSRLAAIITSCLVDIQPVSERSVLSFIPHHTVHNNWRRWTRDGLEPGRKTIGRVVLYRSLWGPSGPIPRGAALRNNVNNHNKYSLLMHCIKIKSPAKFLLNEQYVFVGGNISFLCVLSENRIFTNFLKSLKTCLVGVFWVFQGILA